MDIRQKSRDLQSKGLTEASSRKVEQHNLKDLTAKKASKNQPITGYSGYHVNLSPESVSRSQARQKAYDIASSTSPLREERVQQLKKQISEGRYQIDPGKIADGMLKESIREHLATNSIAGEP